jgi:hypothetical protein
MRGWLPATFAAVALAGCASSPTADDDSAGAQDDDDTTAATDDDDTTTEPCDGITWGAASAFTVGEPVGNWALHGYVDEDGDGAVDQVETPFTMQDIQCRGHEAVVIVVGDTT